MKKFITLLLLCLTGMAAWAQNPVTNVNATFSNTGTSWTGVNISVAATDADGNAVSGVTATVNDPITAPKTVGSPGTNCIVINKNSNAMSNEPLNFTISGLPAGSKFNRINLPMYAITGGGGFQQNAGQSDVTFKVTVIEGGNTLYESTITNFNVPQIQKGNLNDLLVYECGEDIVTSGGDVQVNFSISKGAVNNGMCMAFESLKLYYLGAVDYTVNVTGATGGGVSYDGHTYNNGDKITATGLNVADLVATSVDGYMPTITIDDLTIKVEYVNTLNASINYTPLTTDCWSEWSGDVPSALSEYETSTLYVLEKTVIVEQRGTLQSTFIWTGGSHRIDVVGVDIIDGTGAVVASDYHFGYSGGQKVDHVYTVRNIPAGNYTVRYISHYTDGSYDTNGHIDNVFTPSVTKTYTVNITGAPDGTKITYNDVQYGNGESFEATDLRTEEITPAEVEGYRATVTIVDDAVNVVYKEYQAREAVVGTDDSVFTPGWYQIQIGSGVSQIHPTSTGKYLAGYPRTVGTNNWGIGLVEDGNDLNTYVYISGSHNAFNIQFHKGGSGTNTNIAEYYAGTNCLYTTTAPSNLHFIPNTAGTEWRIQGNGAQNWTAWDLNGPAVGSSSTASYAENYFVFTRINELPTAVVPEVGKAYRVAILKSDGTKNYISGTGVTTSAADADVLTVENSGNAEYPFTFVTADGKYLTSHGVQATAVKGNKTMFKGGTLGSAGSSYVTCSQVIKDGTYYLTALERWVNTSKGNIILKESDNTFNNSDAPFMRGDFSSAIIFEEVKAVTYTVHISDNAPGAKVTYEGEEYANGETFEASSLQESELSATDIEGLDYSIVISGTDVNVTYATPLIDVTKTYYMLSYDAPTDMYVYMSSTTGDGNVVLSTTEKTEIQFEKISTGVYAIKGDGKYIGASTWNAVPATTALGWTVAKTEDGIFTFYQNTAGTYTGYLGTDAAKLLTAEAKLYNNKGATDPHQFILVEVKHCPVCDEVVDEDATVCPKCGANLLPHIDITIGATGYATMAYYDDFVKPEGLKVYYCTDEGEAGHLTPVEWDKNYLPGYCAYILEGTPNTTYTFNYLDEDFEMPEEDLEAVGELFYGALYGNFDDTDMTVEEAKADYGENIYVFSKKNEVLGFYKYTGTTLAAHKAFYATENASINGFSLDFGGQTVGVNSVISATNLKAGYDIQGRKLNKIQKGINILGGKKIIK